MSHICVFSPSFFPSGFLLVWAMTGEEGMVGGTFFGLYVLFLLCVLAGILVPYIKLPPLLGNKIYILLSFIKELSFCC